ncbi:GAF and ANTAR domain-containing protein [Streptomyces aureocirculatus]|uniref:GAF and ANTAR domain-containing protein n=1 Tax=Streptomyces aureocirculatus TaxID=67275 RepID=UPI000B2BAD16|nr:GAF and ANTAR domain-containing protein [Streptomyces aureocirculatus]
MALAARYADQTRPAHSIGKACHAALRGSYSVGMTLAADAALARRVSLCAVGPLADRGEALQINLGEGPCVQALRQRAPVLAENLDDPDTTHQWPVYAKRATAHHIHAAFALPILHGTDPARQAGLVLTLYRDRRGPMTDADLRAAQDHADAAELLLLTAPGSADGDLAHAWLLPTHAVVHQAIGVISYRHTITTGQALALLRAHAHTQDTDLTTLAHAIVHDHLVLPESPEPPPSGSTDC